MQAPGRAIVSGMARMGIPPHVADKILNHQSGTISGVNSGLPAARFPCGTQRRKRFAVAELGSIPPSLLTRARMGCPDWVIPGSLWGAAKLQSPS
jgi:hypothetical protein